MPEPVAPRIPRTRRRLRWRRKSVRRTARVAAIAAAATVLVLIAGLFAWRSYSEWRLGRIVLTNDGPTMTVQVLDESGREPIGEPVEVFRKSTLALPDGDYRLQVNQEGRLGRTYRFAVNRGETIAHWLSLDEGRLLGRDPVEYPFMGRDRPREEPMPFALVTAALELTPGKSDIVEFTGRTVIRRDGTTGNVVWDAASPRSPHDPGRDPALWLRRIGPNAVGLLLLRTGDGPRWRRYPGRARGPRRRPGVPRPVGQGRFDALELRPRARRPRRTAAGRPGASRAGPIRRAGKGGSSAGRRSGTSMATACPT